ncbi:hypothetical protein [Nocardia sp. NPDC050710]|uniref:hypothetical protein n=1 Tax=Nocardia sp. NPDC050710 TaxID=3157220 RepID=UPI0034089B12
MQQPLEVTGVVVDGRSSAAGLEMAEVGHVKDAGSLLTLVGIESELGENGAQQVQAGHGDSLQDGRDQRVECLRGQRGLDISGLRVAEGRGENGAD